MPVRINERKGPLFGDAIRYPDSQGREQQAIVVGDMEQAEVKTGDGRVIVRGRIDLVPITVEGGRLARTYVFRREGDNKTFPFGEEMLSSGSRLK